MSRLRIMRRRRVVRLLSGAEQLRRAFVREWRWALRDLRDWRDELRAMAERRRSLP